VIFPFFKNKLLIILLNFFPLSNSFLNFSKLALAGEKTMVNFLYFLTGNPFNKVDDFLLAQVEWVDWEID